MASSYVTRGIAYRVNVATKRRRAQGCKFWRFPDRLKSAVRYYGFWSVLPYGIFIVFPFTTHGKSGRVGFGLAAGGSLSEAVGSMLLRPAA